MPKVSELGASNYLKQDDVGSGLDLTIVDVVQEDVQNDDGKEKLWVLHFREVEKGFICKKTNGEIIADILHDDEMYNWKNKRIQLYTDPSVSFAGKRTGGIRARACSNGHATSAYGPTDQVAMMRQAWAKFGTLHAGKSAEEIAGFWRDAIKNYFGGKGKDAITGIEWRRFIDDGFVPMTNPIPEDGGIPESDIPFAPAHV